MKVMLPSMRWLFLHSPPASGVQNMATDEALMRRAASAGDAVFRVYGWIRPTLSLGRNQRARDGYDRAAAGVGGVRIVRRPTGGRALLHHREVPYSATMRVWGGDDSRAAYPFINEVLLSALRRRGAPATLATRTTAAPPG